MVGAALSSEDGSVLPFAVTPSRVSAPADEDSSPRPSEAVVYPFYRDLERNSLFSRGEVETFAFGGREALSIDSPPFQPGSPVIRLAAPTEPLTWSLASREDVTGLSSGEDVSFVSGDVADSSGLLTLLQRGIRRIVWVELGPGDGSPNARTPRACSSFSKDVLRKFGCTGYGETSCYGQQVFQDAQLPSLILRRSWVTFYMILHLQQMLKQGSPGILRRSLQVLPNKRWCIKGGFTLELLLIHIETWLFFHPWAVAGHLAKLTNRQANLLAALAEHIVGQALPSIRSLIRPPVPPLQMSFAQRQSFDQQLPTLAAAALTPPAEGILGRLVTATFGRLLAAAFDLRPGAEPEATESDPSEGARRNLAKLAESARCLDAGDAAGALQTIEELTGDCGRVAQPWAQRLRHALIVQQTLRALCAKAECLNASLPP
eukprot:s628_g6.t1